jgi:hypothetical protein
LNQRDRNALPAHIDRDIFSGIRELELKRNVVEAIAVVVDMNFIDPIATHS